MSFSTIPRIKFKQRGTSIFVDGTTFVKILKYLFIHFPKFGHPHGRPGGLRGSCLPPSGLPWPAKNSVVLHFLRKKVTFLANTMFPPLLENGLPLFVQANLTICDIGIEKQVSDITNLLIKRPRMTLN